MFGAMLPTSRPIFRSESGMFLVGCKMEQPELNKREKAKNRKVGFNMFVVLIEVVIGRKSIELLGFMKKVGAVPNYNPPDVVFPFTYSKK